LTCDSSVLVLFTAHAVGRFPGDVLHWADATSEHVWIGAIFTKQKPQRIESVAKKKSVVTTKGFHLQCLCVFVCERERERERKLD
jgi:hypothetical protein